MPYVLAAEVAEGGLPQQVPEAKGPVQAASEHCVLVGGVPLHSGHLHGVALGFKRDVRFEMEGEEKSGGGGRGNRIMDKR